MDLFLVDTSIVAYSHPFVAHVMVVEVHVLIVSFEVVYDLPNVVFVPTALVWADLNL